MSLLKNTTYHYVLVQPANTSSIMKLSSIAFFAFFINLFNKYNPYRLPTLKEKRIQMLHKTKQNLVQTRITNIELEHTINAKKQILKGLIWWKQHIVEHEVLYTEVYVIDEKIKEIEMAIFELELDHDNARASTDLYNFRLTRISEQLKPVEDHAQY